MVNPFQTFASLETLLYCLPASDKTFIVSSKATGALRSKLIINLKFQLFTSQNTQRLLSNSRQILHFVVTPRATTTLSESNIAETLIQQM